MRTATDESDCVRKDVRLKKTRRQVFAGHSFGVFVGLSDRPVWLKNEC